MRSDETSHRTHRAHRTCVRLRRWEDQRRLSSFDVFLVICSLVFSFIQVADLAAIQFPSNLFTTELISVERVILIGT